MSETIETSRRGFLRGLIAAAVATQLPELPAAKAETLVEAIEPAILINGRPLTDLHIEAVGNDWYRVSGRCPEVNWGDGWSFDFTAMNDGMGIFMGDEAGAEQHLAEHPTHVVTRGVTSLGATLSCYLKMGPKFKGHPQLAGYTGAVVAGLTITSPPDERTNYLHNSGTYPENLVWESQKPARPALPKRTSRTAAYSHLPRWQRPGGR